MYSPVDSSGRTARETDALSTGIMSLPPSGIWPVGVARACAAISSISSIHLLPDGCNIASSVDVNINGPTNGLRVNGLPFADTNLGGHRPRYFRAIICILTSRRRHFGRQTKSYLYNLQIAAGQTNSTVVDSSEVIFGMRKNQSWHPKRVQKKSFLNNQFTFEFGPLDQGYWPDGVYTAPTDSGAPKVIWKRERRSGLTWFANTSRSSRSAGTIGRQNSVSWFGKTCPVAIPTREIRLLRGWTRWTLLRN